MRTRTEECVRDGISYRVETTWDDESGNAEIREFDQTGTFIRRCEWSIWPEENRRDGLIGEAVWFYARGVEIERVALSEHP